MGPAFLIPAAMSVAGGVINSVNQRNAANREQGVETQAIQNQQAYRDRANALVNQQTQKIATSNPNTGKETADFVNVLRRNIGAGTDSSGGSTSALGSVPGASSRYGKDVASAGANVQSYGNTQAGDMSAIDSAIRQRQNEAGAMQDLQSNLNVIGQQSAGQGFVDQLRAKAAGQGNPWVSMFGNTLTKTGGMMAGNGWFQPSPKPAGGQLGYGT